MEVRVLRACDGRRPPRARALDAALAPWAGTTIDPRAESGRGQGEGVRDGWPTLPLHDVAPSVGTAADAGFLGLRSLETRGPNATGSRQSARGRVTQRLKKWHGGRRKYARGLDNSGNIEGNSNDLFTARVAPRAPLSPSRGARARVCPPASCCPPWRTPRSGTPWAPRALETIPCHASAPAAGAGPLAGHGEHRWLVTGRLRGWGGSEGAAANGSGGGLQTR